MDGKGTSKFFNSTETDVRSYSAQDLADYLSKFYSNGVIGEHSLKVQSSVPPGMSIVVNPGAANINGYMYSNDEGEAIALTAPAASTVIYKVVLRLDLNEDKRNITTQVLEVSAPTGANQVDLQLATFYLGSTSTAPYKIVDNRKFSKGLFTEDLTDVNKQLNLIVNTANKAYAELADNAATAVEYITSLSKEEIMAKVEAVVIENELKINAACLNGYTSGDFWKHSELTSVRTLGGKNIYSGTDDPQASTGEIGDIYVKYKG